MRSFFYRITFLRGVSTSLLDGVYRGRETSNAKSRPFAGDDMKMKCVDGSKQRDCECWQECI